MRAYRATKAKIEPPASREVIKQLTALEEYIDKNKSEVSMDDVEEEIIPFYHAYTLKEILVRRSRARGESFPVGFRTLGGVFSSLSTILFSIGSITTIVGVFFSLKSIEEKQEKGVSEKLDEE